MTIRHSKQLTQPDGADTSKVRPSDWNDDHVDENGIPVTAFRVVGPYTVNWDTAGFMAPSDDGYSVFAIPAGSLFQVWGFITESFLHGDGFVLLGFTPDPTVAGHFIQLAAYTGTGPAVDPPNGFSESRRFGTSGADIESSLPRWSYTADERFVVASYQPNSNNADAGSIDVYALIATLS